MGVPVRRRRPRPGARGFKLIEILIAMAVLGITSAALVTLHGAVIGGIARSEDTSVALDVAAQRLETLGAMDPANLPNCTSPGGPGCQAPGLSGFLPELGVAGGFACTRWVDSADVPMATGAALPVGTRFRVDTLVANVVGATQLPGARLLTVSVCWMDLGNTVRQVQASRMVVPGV